MIKRLSGLFLLLVMVTGSFTVGVQAYTGDVIFVDAAGGDDRNDGRSSSAALRTLQRAASLAEPGTVVRILPGVYRESIRPAASGTAAAPIVFVADQGPGTVTLRGSEPSASLVWSRLSSNTIGLPSHVSPTELWVADLSAWALDSTPRFVAALDAVGEIQARMPLAREPDWHVETPWRYAEYWWTADGGRAVAACDPSDPANDWNCDLPSRCDTNLTDRSAFAEPLSGIEVGDLKSLGDLTGAEVVALDAKWGHYLYRRRIVAHDVAAGRVTVAQSCLQDGGSADPGLGWGTKYYVEDHPALLDSPGEWWYDVPSRKLYVWPLSPGDPSGQQIEISWRGHGFDLTGRSYITLDGLTVELFDGNAIHQANYWAQRSYGNTLRNLTLRYANQGVLVQQSVRADQSAENVTRDFTLEDSEIAYMDTHGLFMTPWWDGAPGSGFPRSGIHNTVISGNEFHHLGFRTDLDDPIGVKFQFADRLRFENNHVHNTAHNGVQFLWSVIDSDLTYGVPPDAIRIGEILVKDNLIEDTCQITTDCSALKFWGQPPNNHIFRDVLVTGNTFRNVFAWSHAAKQRVGWWSGGEGCEVKGQAGFGFYLDYASGIHLYRNLLYNTSYAGVMLAGTWRDGDLVFANNTIVNALYGLRLSGVEADTHGGNVNTRLLNNIIAGSEGYGIYQCTANENFGSLQIDHNLYYNNGWRAYNDGGVWRPGAMAIRNPTGQKYYPTLSNVRDHPYRWELHGIEGDPGFSGYDPNDHDPYNGAWPDFSLTGQSVLLQDAGSALPESLTGLLQTFGLDDGVHGSAPDIGRQELSPTEMPGFFVTVTPLAQQIAPGGVATYTLEVRAGHVTTTELHLAAENPDPRFVLELSPTVLVGDGQATLTLHDTLDVRGGAYLAPITVTDGEITQTLEVELLIVTSRIFLPLVTR